MPRPKCIAGALCSHAASYTKALNGASKTYLQGRNIPEHKRVQCAYEGCHKTACLDGPACLAALHRHYNLEHGPNPLQGFEAEQIHSLARSLTFHFALEYDLNVARANHAIVPSLPNGIDCSQPGLSDRNNSHCAHAAWCC